MAPAEGGGAVHAEVGRRLAHAQPFLQRLTLLSVIIPKFEPLLPSQDNAGALRQALS